MLVLRCQLGDESAFVQLWQRHREPLGQFVRRIVLPGVEVDDVLRDAIGHQNIPAALQEMNRTLSRLADMRTKP